MSNLKKARESLNIKQADIAKIAGISLMTYQRYESGERIPNVKVAIKIATSLNKDLQELFKE